MAIKLLVVDDSSFFQKRITEILKPETNIKIVGFANNGREAIEKAQSLNPDVITMDYEMPVMDGLTALRNIMQVKPTPVLMFSSLTYDGARVTLDALDAGAIDFLPKNFEDLQRGGTKIRSLLSEKIKSVAKGYNRSASAELIKPTTKLDVKSEVKTNRNITSPKSTEKPLVAKKIAVPETKPATTNRTRESKQDTKLTGIELVLIGTSTGGPVALQKVLTGLPSSFPRPILLIQHMPSSFTAAFAERLNGLCKIQVKLAKDGDVLKAGVAYLAPGGQQMMVERGKLRVVDGDDRMNYRPCVDLTFASAAKNYPKKSLGIILTGMGSDGAKGAQLMKDTGCPIWSQDKETCVIYGMPMAIAKANIQNATLPLQKIGPLLVQEVK